MEFHVIVGILPSVAVVAICRPIDALRRQSADNCVHGHFTDSASLSSYPSTGHVHINTGRRSDDRGAGQVDDGNEHLHIIRGFDHVTHRKILSS